MNSDLSIKIDFLKNRNNPSEVFQAMALYINGYKDLGQLITNALDQECDFELILDDIAISSVIGKLSILKEKLLGAVANTVIDSSFRLFDDLVEHTESESDIELLALKLESKLYENSESQLDPYVDRKNLATVLSKLSEANSKLLPNEHVEFTSALNNGNVATLNSRWRFTGNPKAMFLGASESYAITDKLYVKIAVNEGEGHSVWTFKSPIMERSFSARIVNNEWLERYQQGLILPIGPKDMIDADITYDIYKTPSGKGQTEIRNAKIIKINSIIRSHGYQHELSNF